MKRLLLLLAIAAVMVLAPLRTPSGRTATPIDVTVTILRVVQVQDPDPAPFQGDADFYAKVRIDGFGFQDTESSNVDSPDVSPNWRFTQTVDRDLGTIPITIQIWDDDTALAAPDDISDLNPIDGVQELSLVYNLTNGTWSGDVPANQGFSQGDGDHEDFGLTEGGEAAKVFFDISLSDGDIDDDGIPDGVERFGVRDINGNIVADMAALGADPCRKTMAIEIDWMAGAADGHNHMPKPAAVQDAKNAWSSSTLPVTSPCPYAGFPNGTGGNLVIDVSNSIPEAPVLGLGADFDAVRNANFNSDRRPYFHYVVFAHDQAAGSSSSGLCCSGNKDYIVTLGSWRTGCIGPGPNGTLDTTPSGDDVIVGQSIIGGPDRICNSLRSGDDSQSQTLNCVGPGINGVLNTTAAGDDTVSGTKIVDGPNGNCDTTATGDDVQLQAVGGGAADYEVGTVRDQSGTILHEGGHSLGLGHGGVDGTNYKPNYLSVMNYAFDPGGVPDLNQANFRLDYSRSALNDLTETTLSEPAGISDGTDFTYWTDLAGKAQGGPGNAALNWDNVGGATGTANVDVNNDGACVSAGANNTRDTTPSGDDVIIGSSVRDGPDHTCNTTKSGDDVQDNPVNTVEPTPLKGFDDWSNLKFRAALSVNAGGAAFTHGPDITFEEANNVQAFFAAFFDPNLQTTKDVDKADAAPGEDLTYTVKVDNVGTGDAKDVSLADTLPDASADNRNLPDIPAGGTHSETIDFTVPCATTDLTVLTNSATVSSNNLLGNPELDGSNNTDTASTTVHAPVLTLSKTATATVNAGEAISYTITYENTGSGAASNVKITDTIPAGEYYSKALDLGVGPKPDTVTLNVDGTRTLVWNVGTVAGSSGSHSINFTARPTLLALGGRIFTNNVALDFESTGGCVYPTVKASASTTITVVPPSKNPLSLGYWRNHPNEWTSEIRARIQATDQRFDGRDGTTPDGALSATEVAVMYLPGGNFPKILEEQQLSVYFNLATRRINAGTVISSKLATKLGLHNVRDAAVYAMGTLLLPVNGLTKPQYSDINDVLDQINQNKNEVY